MTDGNTDPQSPLMPPKVEPAVFLTDKLFDEMLVLWQENNYIPDDLIEVTRQAILPLSLPMRALNAYRNGEWEACANHCRSFYHFQSRLPNRLLGLMADAAGKCNRRGLLSWPLLQFGESALEEEQLDTALAAFRQVFSFSEAIDMRESPPVLMRVARDLGILSAGLSKSTEVAIHPPGELQKIAWVTSELPSHGARNIFAEHFAQFSNRDKVCPFVYIVQPLQHAQPEDFSIPLASPAEKPGERSESLVLGNTKTPVRHMPDLHYSEGARWLVRQLDEDEIDVVIFEGGVESPLMWVASELCNIPVKICVPGATNMYQPGISGTIYTDPASLEREKSFWQLSWGEQILLPGAVDCNQARDAYRPDNADLDLPDKAIVIGVYTDSAEGRFSRQYLAAVEKVMKACPDAYFLTMGNGNTTRARGLMREAGLGHRCRWIGPQENRFSALKRLDLYLNEIPIGGVEVLREAMACKTPCLAMLSNDHYYESAGASLLGTESPACCRTEDEYVRRAIELIHAPELRAELAGVQYRKALQEFSPQDFVDKIIEISRNLSDKRQALYEATKQDTVRMERSHERLGRRHHQY